MGLPEQIDDEDLEPHSVRWLIVPGLAAPARRTASRSRGSRCAAASPPFRRTPRTWLRFGTTPPPGDIIPKFTAMSGKAMGVEHAVLFRAHDLQAPPEFLTEAMQD